MPVDRYPTFNFVGRIVGPRGRTIKEIERKTGVKILVRGRGSVRDEGLALANKPNYEHLKEPLHVILQVEDTEDRVALRLAAAEEEIVKLTNPEFEDGRDEIKRKQLTELAILNGTYSPSGCPKSIQSSNIPTVQIPQHTAAISQYPIEQSVIPQATMIQNGNLVLANPGQFFHPQILYPTAENGQQAPVYYLQNQFMNQSNIGTEYVQQVNTVIQSQGGKIASSKTTAKRSAPY